MFTRSIGELHCKLVAPGAQLEEKSTTATVDRNGSAIARFWGDGWVAWGWMLSFLDFAHMRDATPEMLLS